MNFERMFFSTTVLIPLALAVVISVALLFFPLVGALGFEYAAVTGFLLSFIAVFISAELITGDNRSHSAGKRISDRVSSILLVNFLILAVVYLIGLLGSVFKGDCFIKEGTVFFLLITVVSVFFSSALGLLSGFVLRRRGFIAGALSLVCIFAYALLELYNEPSLFVYNPLFGFFPGPIYDEAIPVTDTLIAYRLITVLWGLLFLILLYIANGFSYRRVGAWDMLKLVAVGVTLVTAYSYEHELGISYDREYITGEILPASYETDDFIIYYDPASKAARRIDLIAGDHEWRYRELSEFLELDTREKIRSYVYPDAETRKRVVGAGDTTIANPIHKEIHLVYDAFPDPILKHELTHVMAGDFGTEYLRMSPKVGLLEGLAVAADWSGDGYDPHQWSKAITENGMAPDIEDITGFGFWYAPPAIAYTLMGSFSRYLIDTYGMDKFKTVYRTGNFSVYGKTLTELETEWKNFLKGVPASAEINKLAKARFGAPGIFTASCPRRVAELKAEGFEYYGSDNFGKARESFAEALQYDGSDPVLLNGLAYSCYYEGDYDEAGRIAGETDGLTQVDRAALENLRANALWQKGDTQAAGRIFSSLRAGPLPDDLKREIDIKLTAIDAGGTPGESVRDFFSTRDRTLQSVSLSESILNSPDYAPSYYLLGRLLYNTGEYERAVPYLSMAEYLGLPTEELTRENLRLLGISLFATGRYDESDMIWSRVASGGDNESRAYALDFLKRSAWGRKNLLK
ncbi:MAG: tetratricopeptide repeat protein [Thermodesulfobacteriota bacterium]